MGPKPKFKKVVIDYPPLTLRKWKPPFKPHVASPMKRKPITRKPQYPEMHKIPNSSLQKIWHQYRIFAKNSAILFGKYSQNDARFPIKFRGKQAPAICFVAIGYTKMKDMTKWDANSISAILQTGTKLYEQSAALNKTTCDCTTPKEVHPEFFIDETKFVLMVDDNFLKGTLFKEAGEPTFQEQLRKVFPKTNYCILEVDAKYMAIWKYQGSFYIFDPYDRDETGQRVAVGLGVAVTLKFTEAGRLIKHIQDTLAPNEKKVYFSLHLMYIKKSFKEALAPPRAIEDIVPPPPPKTATKKVSKSCIASKAPPVVIDETKVGPIPEPPGPPKKHKKGGKEKKEKKESDAKPAEEVPAGPVENTPEYGDLVDEERLRGKEHLFPVEKPTAPSVTYYTWVLPNRMAILIGNCHQLSNRCTKFEGKQSLGNAIAAIGMLRQYKSKLWYPKLIDEMLLTGETIYIQSRQNFIGDQELTLYNVVKKFSINNKYYMHEIEEVTFIGKLNSEKASIMDLKFALQEFFADNDAGIIRGPVLIAVWLEEGKFYMFDPNECDKIGRRMEQDHDPEADPGFACVTCFATVDDLSRMYMRNLLSEVRREPFYISKIQIKDFVETPAMWNNFTALKPGKWILRGTFSQNSTCFSQVSRNSQCTAMATLAVAFSKVFGCSEWDRSLMDEILLEGDKYYNLTVAALKEKNIFKEKMLLLDEVLRKYIYKDKQLNITIEECLVNGGVNMLEKIPGVPDLKEGFEEFFRDYDSGVLTCRGLSVGIWKCEDHYYYFDSHGRNERGYTYEGGLSCCLRFETLSEMTRVVLFNLNPQGIDFYNIGRVDATIWEKTSDGTVKPDFFNYLELSPKKGIIRASTHQGNIDTFDTRADKQTIGNILAAFGMTTLLPAYRWNSIVMDHILNIGDKLYDKSRLDVIMKDLENKEKWETEKPINMDLIDTKNVNKVFKIGANKITFEIKDAKQGIFEPERVRRDRNGNVIYQSYELQNMLWNSLEDKTVPKDSKHEIIIESEHITVAIWKDTDIFYVFDPKGKDYEGNCFGRDLWSAKIVILDENYEMDEDMYGEMGHGVSTTISQILKQSENPETRKTYDTQITEYEGEEEEEEDLDEEIFPMTIDISDAKACTIMFTTFDDLYQHIMENVRPNKRVDKFRIYPLVITSLPVLKLISNPMNRVLGNWFNFEEIDSETWILRGTSSFNSSTFPDVNRGKQYGAMCVGVCVYCRLYALAKFKNTTIDYILKYGDKIHTAVRKRREEKLHKENPMLTNEELEEIVGAREVKPTDVADDFYIGEYLVHLKWRPRYVDGDITLVDVPPPPPPEPTAEELAAAAARESMSTPGTAKKSGRSRASRSRASRSRASKPVEGGDGLAIPDPNAGKPEAKRTEPPKVSLKKALDKFFNRNSFGIMSVKGICMAMFVIKDGWYLFGPDPRGPSGSPDINGTACIIRFKSMDKFIDHVQNNYLTVGGSNFFHMDGVTMSSVPANRPAASIPAVLPVNPNMTAFHPINPGKHILRGTFHQNNPKFNLPEDATSSCNALVALAMAQIHPADTWTKPIVDDVLVNACRLYKQSVDARGYDFNAWEDKMVLDVINKEFTIGVITVNWGAITEGFKRGILTIKNPDIPSLRKTMDEFFLIYNMGVIECNALTVAIWLKNNLLYMFDPNPRGATGILTSGGTACLLIFKNVKDLVDHYLTNVPPRLQSEEFTVSPIEIITYETKPPRPVTVKKSDILKVKEIDSLSGYVSEKGKEHKKHGRKDDVTCDKPPKSAKKSRSVSPKKAKSTKDPCCCTDKARVIPHDKIIVDESKFSPEEKKQWMREKSEAKKIKELQAKEHRLRAMFYDLDNGDAIVRAHYSQNSDRFSTSSRNKQAHANALVAIVMYKLHEPKTWSYKNIEIILESGDVLYKDSYMKYRPKNPLLGLKNLMRTFYIFHLKITTLIFKPFIFGDCRYEDLYVGLLNFFMQETAGILVSEKDSLALAIFQKAGQYYMFDPHDRDVRGDVTSEKGCACLMRFTTMENLIEKYLRNSGIDQEDEVVPRFSVCAVTLESVEKITK